LGKVREPTANDFDAIYEMGFDVWSDGDTLEEYLNGCRNSVKYRHGQWFVLEEDKNLVSSLLIHSFDNYIFGIGSIATSAPHRKFGHASKLIDAVIKNLQEQQNAKLIYLYSDINPEFYHRFGFVPLPKEQQQYSTSTCMVLMTKGFEVDFQQLNPPKYF
jgi:N-acetylglutamate synthase-like GNAT family acetyltransferase